MLDILDEKLPDQFCDAYGLDDGIEGDYSAITYVSAPCSAGKTHALAHLINDALSRDPFDEPMQFLYVAPTKKLLEEFSQRLTDLGIRAKKIIAGQPGFEASVFESLTQHLRRKELYDASHVTLITHASFLKLPVGLRHPKRWRVFIDEQPQIDDFLMAQLPQTRNTLAGYLEVRQYTEALARIEKKSGTSVDSLLGDTGFAGIKDVLHRIESPNYAVYTAPEAFDRVFDPTRADFDPTFSLPLLALVNPDIFDGCCFLSANFEGSMVFDLLKRHKKRLSPHRALTRGLRYERYDQSVGLRASIKYVLEGARYSKSIRNKSTSDGNNVKTAIDAMILAHLGDEPFLLVANNDDQGLLVNSKGAERLSGSPHGLNCYQHQTRIVCLSARNRKPEHLAMLKKAGFSQDTIQRSTLVEAVHQAVMRTALRDPSSTATVEIIVPDEWTAKELGKILGCSAVSKLGTVSLNAPPKPYTPKEKNRRANFQKMLKSLPLFRQSDEDHYDDTAFAAISLPSLLKSIGKGTSFAATTTNNTTDNLVSGNRIGITLHRTKYATGSGEHFEEQQSVVDFVNLLKVAAKTPISTKEESWLFSASTYKRNVQRGHRTKENFRGASCLVLDFDGGSLSPEMFEDLFWRKAGIGRKRSFVICNTFSRSVSRPNCFRVIMPFKQPTTSIETFEGIFEEIVQRIEDAGFPREAAKLDKVCRCPTHSWYLPCTNRQEKDQAFIHTFGMQTRGVQRHGIDPQAFEFTRHCGPATKVEIQRNSSVGRVGGQREVELLKSTLRSMTSNRHQLFFELGVMMARKYGYPMPEVERNLFEVAGSDPKMRKKARDIMRSLKVPVST